MSRAGRKRKPGDRYPNGQLKRRKPDVDDRIRTSRQPHRRMLKAEDRTHEEAESPIGRLWLKGHLKLKSDPDEVPARDRYDAADMFAKVVGEYRSVIGSPRDVAGSGRGYPCDPSACAKPDGQDDCQCLKRRRRYEAAYLALAGHARDISLEIGLDQDMSDGLRAAIIEHRRLRADEACIAPAAHHRRVVMAVMRAAIHRESVAPEDFVYLVTGLEELRRHFGLTARRPRRHSSNAN